MFLDITQQDRDAFVKQNNGCLIPGYTGHCPTLKFRFGKPYGANTKEAIQELGVRETPVKLESSSYQRRDDVPHKDVLAPVPIVREKGQTEDYSMHLKHRSRRYILGYTGYIPGFNFRFGKSFQRAADDSCMEFSRRMAEENLRRERDKRSYRSRSAPRTTTSIRSRDDVKKSLDQFSSQRSYNNSHISPESPPIAGYTGHIPHLKDTDASLSQRYGAAARQGLKLLQEDRERHRS